LPISAASGSERGSIHERVDEARSLPLTALILRER
jgi:hypothetical protein